MQLSFDAADRLVELVEARRGPVPVDEAARTLFALASAPALGDPGSGAVTPSCGAGNWDDTRAAGAFTLVAGTSGVVAARRGSPGDVGCGRLGCGARQVTSRSGKQKTDHDTLFFMRTPKVGPERHRRDALTF